MTPDIFKKIDLLKRTAREIRYLFLQHIDDLKDKGETEIVVTREMLDDNAIPHSIMNMLTWGQDWPFDLKNSTYSIDLDVLRSVLVQTDENRIV